MGYPSSRSAYDLSAAERLALRLMAMDRLGEPWGIVANELSEAELEVVEVLAVEGLANWSRNRRRLLISDLGRRALSTLRR